MKLTEEHIAFLVKHKPFESWNNLYKEFRKYFKLRVGDATIRRAYYRGVDSTPVAPAETAKPHTILTISDMHIPYHHEDSIPFLKAIRDKYQPDEVVSIGDLNDWHGISFHSKDADLASPGSELRRNRKYNQALEAVFPEMYIIGSNHGDLPLRKMVFAGLPRDFLRPYNEIYQVGPGWKFVDDLVIKSAGRSIYFVHGISKNGLKLAAQRGLNVVQGHYHTVMKVDYVSNPENLLWSMQIGCLIDKRSLAFEYGRLNLDRPIIGTGIIINGVPRLLPMHLNKKGRWVGDIP